MEEKINYLLSDKLKVCKFLKPKEILDESKEIELLRLIILQTFLIKKSQTNQDPNPNFRGQEGLIKTSKEREGEKHLKESRT